MAGRAAALRSVHANRATRTATRRDGTSFSGRARPLAAVPACAVAAAASSASMGPSVGSWWPAVW